MGRFLLGIDAGSSVTKVSVFDRSGAEIGQGRHRIVIDRPHAGWCETDPAAAWKAARSAIADALAAACVRGEDIAAIGISAAMVGAWLVDGQGNALRPGIIWEDSRTQSMLDGMAARDPGFYRRIFESDGCVMQQGCTLPLMAWLRENEPEIMRRAAHVFSYKDFLRMKLTGVPAADRTEAAVAPGDARRADRSAGMLDLFALGDLAGKLPAVADSEALAGHVTPDAARATGLAAGTPVAVGAGDVPSTVIGAGALEHGTAVIILGTTCIAGVVSDEPVFAPPDLGLLFTLPAKAWLRAMVNVSGTLNLDWAIAAVLGEATHGRDLFDALEAMVSTVPVGADGVVFLPYLSDSGIIAPVVDARARAGFYGLTPRHGRAHLMRAVYEGVVLAIRDLFAGLPAAGGDILLTGGGANSGIWPQMIADALGRTVLVPAGGEFGARGAALLAGTAIGWFPSIRAASVASRRIERRHEPDPALRGQWEQAFATYRDYRDKILRPAG